MIWNEWVTHHARLFGMVDQRDLEMLDDWTKLFTAEGFAPTDLAEASDWIAMNDHPEFRTQHLPKLTERARGVRQRKAGQGQPVQANPEDCKLCGSPACGWASVPDYAACERSHWPVVVAGTCRYWRPVACRCALGRWQKQQHPEIPSLDEYEQAYPTLAADIKRHWEAHRRYDAAAREAGDLDAALGKVLKRMQRRES